MKNFLLGVLAMLVLFAGGYFVLGMIGGEPEGEGEQVAAGDIVESEVVAGNGARGGSGVRTTIIRSRRNSDENAESVEDQPDAQDDVPGRPEPVPAATATATTAPRPQCNSGPFVATFSADSARISSQARSVLGSAASAYGSCGSAGIRISGPDDSVVQSVRSFLQSQGLPGSRMSVSVTGSGGDGTSRRVEVRYSP